MNCGYRKINGTVSTSNQ